MSNPPAFLSDADVWICFCYTGLARAAARSGVDGLDGPACDSLARSLYADPATRALDPVVAAETYLHAQAAPAE